MELRLALYELGAREGLSPASMRELEMLAGLVDEPASLWRRLSRGVALLAAALGGLGVIFWVAAHWDSLGRAGQFGLLQGLLAVALLGALWHPAARRPLALLAWLNVGGLLAFFGQTYQTGADPWQLFALWALLTLPLALAVRSDLLWLPWALTALTGVALWMQTFTLDRGWWLERGSVGMHLAGWCLGAGLVAAFVPAARRWTGAGTWALRGGCLLWVVLVVGTALHGSFGYRGGALLWTATVVLAVAAAALAGMRRPDVHALSAAALGLDTVLMGGLAHLMFDGPISRGLWELKLALLALAGMALLGATIKGLVHLSKREGEGA